MNGGGVLEYILGSSSELLAVLWDWVVAWVMAALFGALGLF